MPMTHYMELLATHQPWNLLLFMAVPVILAETLAVTELYVLFTRNLDGTVRLVNRTAGIAVGFYFLAVFLYLSVTAAWPLTANGGWRGWIDLVAVAFYLAGVVPLFGIALLELGWLLPRGSAEQRLRVHAALVALFLVVAHVAMIFGMMDPTLGGWQEAVLPLGHHHQP